ncbi:MAG: TolC family protein [Deltaproteobacteria bacterium]|nr:TolC family protein [Deltaproteobacteria bacterium]MBW2254469.1 TolC family protein [Deltaproteobacteria bacterium]
MRTQPVTLVLLLAWSTAAFAQKPSGEATWLPEDATYALGGGGELSGKAWWVEIGDPQLTSVVAQGLEANHDLAAARERVVMADAAASQTLSTVLPSAMFSVSSNTQPYDSLGFQFGGLPTSPGFEPPDLYHTGSATLSVSVPLDVFGRDTLGYRASRFDAEASRGDRDGVRSALAARIVSAYLDLVATREQVDIATRQAQSNEALLEVVELQYELGIAGSLDVLQQRQQVASIRTLLPQARLAQRTAESQLRILLALEDGAPLPEVGTALPELPTAPRTGVPADLLQSRPDLRAAEARLESAERRRLSAIRSLLPTLAVSGQAGWQARYIDEFNTQDTWGLGASLTVPLVQGGRTHASIRQSRASAAASEHTYAAAVLQAVQDVETALHGEAERAEMLAAVRAQHEAARLAWEESRSQYTEGLIPYLSVLLALNSLHTAELSELQSRRALLGARIQLHSALGGAWTEEGR